MAKKDKKKKDAKKASADGTGTSSGAVDAVEAVRNAVERTFQATAEGAIGTQKRTRDLVDEVAGAAARIRETIEDLRVLEDVRALRTEIAALSARVEALEQKPAPAATSRRSTSASSKKPAARSAGAKRGSTASRAKPSASKSAGASKSSGGRSKSAGASKSSGGTTRSRSTSSRSRTSRSSGGPSSGSSGGSSSSAS